MATRTGIAALTVIVKHVCRILTTFRPAIDQVIATSVADNLITSGQATTLKAWLDAAQAACDILRLVSGY
jgi:N-acetyl-gamma-glutamylphosphate reductase